MEENKLEFEIDKLVLSVYNKIAIWNNSDFDTTKQKGDALKVVSHDIVQTALQTIVEELGLKSTTEVFRGDKKVGDISTIKDEESFEAAKEKDILDKLFDK